jgi:hypothetical protein
MLANIPVVIAGDRIAGKLPLKAILFRATGSSGDNRQIITILQ